MQTNILKFLILSFWWTGLSITSAAQPYPCGTNVTAAQIAYEATITDSITVLTGLNRTLHLAVYVVKDNKGNPNLDPAAFSTAVAELNAAYEKISTTFTVHSVTYIDNYNFDEIRLGTNEKSLLAQYTTPDIIRIYLVSRLFNAAGQQICGYAYYPSASTDVILLQKNCLSGTFLTEQMGHLFNLYHTHETAFGNETVKGTNCDTAGDLCCDTPADPGLAGMVTADCRYNGSGKDSEGTYYAVTVHNFMSFSPLTCRCFFSDEQYIRMLNCMLTAKKHLW